MRVWLEPAKVAARGLIASDVVAAIREQNIQVAAGSVGQQPDASAAFQVTVNTLGRLSSEEQFGEIVVKTGADGQVTRLRDVARISMGADSYSLRSLLNGEPAVGIQIIQSPGANALDVSSAVRAAMDRLQAKFPDGIEYRIAYDPTVFVRASLQSVAVTLLEAIEEFRFDALIGGARRDEEKARAKERIFSHRDSFGQWQPKDQRPELWTLFNTRIAPGEHFRVFPISNWTELDIWQYIRLENIPIVPLYFAKERPCVEIDGNLIMADDDRLPEQYRDQIKMRMVRFRTLGCWPLTGDVESNADTIEKIVEEMMTTTKSERTTRVIDFDQDASMEQKKREGYF